MPSAQLNLLPDRYSAQTKWIKTDLRCPKHGTHLFQWQDNGALSDDYQCTKCRRIVKGAEIGAGTIPITVVREAKA